MIIALTKPVGFYLTRVFSGERTFLSPILRPVERAIYAVCGVNEAEEQHWVTYTIAMVFFSAAGFVVLYAIQRLQGVLPFKPAGPEFSRTEPRLQHVGELRHQYELAVLCARDDHELSHADGRLTVHNFVSAATGIALAIALVRGFARRSAQSIGNFWIDMTRCVLYILLPASIVVGLFFVWQGMPQNLNTYTAVTTLEGAKQVIAQGPVASQEVIKMLGTNGGGFFNVNSAHPYENPNALTNFIEMILIIVIGAALTNVFGPNGRQSASGLGDLRGHGPALSRRCRDRLPFRGAGQSRFCFPSRRPGVFGAAGRRQYGRQGGTFRHHQFGSVHDRDDRRIGRRCQHDA